MSHTSDPDASAPDGASRLTSSLGGPDLDRGLRVDQVVETVFEAVRGAVAASGRVRLVGEELDSDVARRLVTALNSAATPGAGGWDDTPAASGANEVVVLLRVGHGGADQADVVVDVQDPTWPVVRHVRAGLPYDDVARRREIRAFFAVRAATWEVRFGHDLPAYATAVAESGLPEGAVVADVGCGTGRALPALRQAVGPTGAVLGVDLTPEMLDAVRGQARDGGTLLVRADAERLPLADNGLDGVFAAGLLPHASDPTTGLRELARVTRPGGRLILFHPSGRAALAARHRRAPSDDDTFARPRLTALLSSAGWVLDRYDDAEHRFYALARRR